MTETKWTPRPWRLEAGTGPHTGTWVITAEGMRSNTPLARLSDFDDAAAHDARLIAAAPELYEAGVELAKASGELIGWHRTDKIVSSSHERRVELMAAIHKWDRIAAKARGEQP